MKSSGFAAVAVAREVREEVKVEGVHPEVRKWC
jgi:hypothetical protein